MAGMNRHSSQPPIAKTGGSARHGIEKRDEKHDPGTMGAHAPGLDQGEQFGGREPAEPENPRRRRWTLALLCAAAVVGVAVGIVYYWHSLSYESTDDAFIDGHIVAVSPRVAGHVAKVYVTDNQWVNQGDLIAELDPADFAARVAAAEAALEAARAGHASRAFGVDIIGITTTAGVEEASAAVEDARAGIETARAAVGTAKSEQAEAEAQLLAAQAAAGQARADVEAAVARQQRAATHLKRIQALVPKHAVSRESLDEALAAARVAEADVAAAREKVTAQEAAVQQAEAAIAAAESGLREAESGVASRSAVLARAEARLASAKSAPKQLAQSRSQADGAEAEVARAEADVRQAKLNLSYTKIYAPISGYVTRKNLEQGAYVQVGQQLLALVDPAVWVTANFKETQLAKMRPGQPAMVTVDARPGVRFAAHVDSIQRGSGARFSLLPPENATGNFVKVVQRVPVKIVFDDLKQVGQYTLGPGMSAVPSVNVGEPGETDSASRGAVASGEEE